MHVADQQLVPVIHVQENRKLPEISFLLSIRVLNRADGAMTHWETFNKEQEYRNRRIRGPEKSDKPAGICAEFSTLINADGATHLEYNS